MATASPLAPKTLKGAFIRLDETGIGAVPQIIVFQYNPENLTRKFKPYEKPADKEGAQVDPTARVAPYDPEEEMDVVIAARRDRRPGGAGDPSVSRRRRRRPTAWRRWRC